MGHRHLSRTLGTAAGLLFLCAVSTVTAVVNWPSPGGWTPVTIGGGTYVDACTATASDPSWAAANPDYTDIVGGVDQLGATYNAGYWANDTVGMNILFRMRVDNVPPTSPDPNNVWTVLLNTTGNDNTDYAVQLDHQFHERVEMAATTAVGPSTVPSWGNLGDLEVGGSAGPQIAIGAITTFSRYVNASVGPEADGSRFHQAAGDDDGFVDVAIPYGAFTSLTGLGGASVQFQVAFASSGNHVNLNKDHPDTGWSDPIVVLIPEPGMVLGALPLLLLACRRRSR